MNETADRVLGGCRIAVLLATAVIQVGLSMVRLNDTTSRIAFTALAGVLVVAAWWVLRWKPVPWPVALAGAVVVLAASTVTVWTLPPDQLLGDEDWASGLAGWHLLVLLLDRPAVAMAALVLQMALTFCSQLGSAPADRSEIGSVVIVGLSVVTFQAATLALIRVVHRRAGEAFEASAERDRLVHRKALAEQREADQRTRFAGQLGATLPLLAGLADRTLDPRDAVVREQCALAATQLRRLFAENDDVPDPLVHEVSACVDLAERRGLTVTLAVSGEPAPVPTDVRRELTGPLMTALVAARSQARVSVLRTGDEIRVAAITDGELRRAAERIGRRRRRMARMGTTIVDGGEMAFATELTAVVVDDHPAVRAGVVYWLSSGTPPVTVVAEGEDVRAAWIGEGAQADVVILDLHLNSTVPAMGDLRRLTEAGRRVVVYSMRADDETVLQCLELGALSYLTKAEGAEHLLEAVRAAAVDRSYTPPSLAGALAGDRSERRPALSARETEVLIEWFQSESKDFVAHRLGISPNTVNSHLERIRVKYAQIGREAPTKAALVARAIQDGLIGVSDL